MVKPVYINRAVSLVVLLTCLSALEGLLRHKGYYYTWSERNGHGYAWVHKNKFKCENLLVPNGRLDLITPEFRYLHLYNREGIRDVDHPVMKPEGEFRIISLGDSYTEGRGAPFEGTWPSIMEDFITSTCGGMSLRSILGGVPGSNISCSLQLFEEQLRKYDPDIVVLAVNNSDVRELIQLNYTNQRLKRPVFAPSKYQLEILYRHSHIIRFIYKELIGFDDYIEWPSEKTSLEDAYTGVRSCILNFIEFSRSDDFDLAIVMHPFNHEAMNGEYDMLGGADRFMGLITGFEEEGVIVIDMLNLFKQELSMSSENYLQYYWPIDYHHNEAGYYEFGRLMAQELLATGFLPCADGIN